MTTQSIRPLAADLIPARLHQAGVATDVGVELVRTELDDHGACAIEIRVTQPDTDERVTITVDPVAFVIAAVELRGVVDGRWLPKGLPISSAIDEAVVVVGDYATLRIADISLSRYIEMDTEAVHDVIDRLQVRHRPTPVEHPINGGHPIDIDEGIAELMRLTWDMGLPTTNSCENQDGMVVITFWDAAGVETFAARIAAQVRPDDPKSVDAEHLYNRITATVHPEDDAWQRFRRRRLWNFGAAYGDDIGGFDPQADEPEYSGPCDVTVSVGVRFPRSDLPAVLDALRQAASRSDSKDPPTMPASP